MSVNDLLIACTNFNLYTEKTNQLGGEYNKLMTKMVEEFNKLKNTKITDKNGFVTNNLTKLYKIHEILIGSESKLNLDASGKKTLRSFYDGFFQKFLGLQRFPSKIKYMPTSITLAFCRGVTFFQQEYERDAHPFYHRSDSCGTETKTAQEKFSTIQVKNAVKLCYLERKIYDKVYFNLLHRQDAGHLREMRVMQQYYDEYFPNEIMKITLKFNEMDNSWPIDLNIVYHNFQNGKIRIDNFRKPYDFIRGTYKDEVYCRKIVNGKEYEKVQTYSSGENAWLLV